MTLPYKYTFCLCSKSPLNMYMTTTHDLCNTCICNTKNSQIHTPSVHLGIVVHV